jgi:hypothetical protein
MQQVHVSRQTEHVVDPFRTSGRHHIAAHDHCFIVMILGFSTDPEVKMAMRKVALETARV